MSLEMRLRRQLAEACSMPKGSARRAEPSPTWREAWSDRESEESAVRGGAHGAYRDPHARQPVRRNAQGPQRGVYPESHGQERARFGASRLVPA
eukprot:3729576-Pyramimonas_sp.AAC.1